MKPELILFDFSGTLAFLERQPNPEDFFSFFKKLGVNIKTKEDKKVFISLFGKLLGQAKNWLDFSQQILEVFLSKPSEKAIRSSAEF